MATTKKIYFIDIKDVNTNKLYNQLLDYFKNGGKSPIHIKKKNIGKFTKSADRVGQTVQEYAHSVMSNPDATTLQKKRANFAIQASKWNHK